MSTGQADSAPGTTDDLAAFLVDNPRADASEDDENDNEPGDSDNSDVENPDDESGAGPDPEDEADPESDPDADPEEDPSSQAKFKVTVKGDDGADTTIEVDQKELIAGYQRHADYTRKTQELGEREREAFGVVSQKLEEGRTYFMQQAQVAHAAVRALAGLRSAEEMAILSQTDAAAWAQEVEREKAINRVLSQLEQGMEREALVAKQQNDAQMQQEFSEAWTTLRKEGIDEPKLRSIFTGIAKEYGVPAKRFAKLSDPKLVMIMRDAMAFRELKTKAPAVKKQVQAAPKLPAARQSVPQSERVSKRLNDRFKGGRAKVDDLAAFLSANKL